MGYVTHVSGEITIQPPITYRELQALGLEQINDNYASKDLYYRKKGERYSYGDVAVRVAMQAKPTEEGLLTVVAGVAIVPAWEDAYKAYSIEEDVHFIATTLAKISPDVERTYEGRLDGEGEDNDDIWRLKIVNGQAKTFKAQIVWDAESE